MHGRIVWAIFRKDLIDAIRDSRVLVAIVVPLVMGLAFNIAFGDSTPKLSATVVYTSPEATSLPSLLSEQAGKSVKLTFKQRADAAAVQKDIDDHHADIGLIVPAGFDAAVKRGARPTLTVIQRRVATPGRDYVEAALGPALLRMAGQEPPANVAVTTRNAPPSRADVFDRLGVRTYFVVASVIFLIAMISMTAVPTILADETEKKTLDAITMVASYRDVIVAKALVGLCYIVVASALLLGLTRMGSAAPATFFGSLLLLSFAMLGCGLLFGQLFRNANQLNTWAGFLMGPLVSPAFLIGFDLPHTVKIAFNVLPTSQAARLAMNGMSGENLFTNAWLSVLVILAWAVFGYGILLWRLSRREG